MESRFKTGDLKRAQYEYGQQPLREEVIEDVAPDRQAVVTRNALGCLVLNTARAMFIDVDAAPPASAGVGGWLASLFGKGTKSESPEIVRKAESWVRLNTRWGFRIYRTSGGYRVLATHDLFDPSRVLNEKIFDEFGSDPLYRKLCKNQESFRARLTPKPWRCGLEAPMVRWPWKDRGEQQRFESWNAEYKKACAEYATCELIAEVGNKTVHAQIRPLIEFHDKICKVGSGLKLA